MGAPVAVVEDHRGLGRRGFPGQGDDLMGRDASFGLGPFRGVRLHKGLEFLQPLDPAAHIRHVVQPLLQDGVDQGVVEGQVGAGPDHQVTVGLGGGNADPGVDIDELGPLFHGV